MKTYKNIFEKTISIESILRAWDEFKIGKRTRPDVQVFEYRLEDNLFALQTSLANGGYKHGPYYAFHISDPKPRLIHKALVRDRIVHHAVYQSLNPIFEPTFIADSYSCRKDKGTHRAVRRLRFFVNKVYKNYERCFALKCDIKKFFGSIDHKILLTLIERKIQDQEMLFLLKNLIHSFTSDQTSAERERERESGCPIGNLTSQLFANIYLNELDQFIKHSLKEKYYLRYTDDFIIVHESAEHLGEVQRVIEDFLASTLRLKLHPDKISIRKYSQGIDFLGYVTLPYARVLRTKTKRRIIKKLLWKMAQSKQGNIDEKNFLQSFASYMGVLSHAESYKLEKKIRQELWQLYKSADG